MPLRPHDAFGQIAASRPLVEDGLLLHVGYHKCASSWLQRRLFVPDNGFAPGDRDGVIRAFVDLGRSEIDPGAARRALTEEIEAGTRRGLVPVLSHERLTGNPHSGGYDQFTVAEQLHGEHPDALVLMVIREQRSMLRSQYQQYVSVGGAIPLARYLEPPRDQRIPLFRWEYLCYDRLVLRYQQLFGADHVRVLAYEQLVADPASFVAAVAELCGKPDDVSALVREAGVRENPGSTAFATAVERRLNRRLSRSSVSPLLHRSRVVKSARPYLLRVATSAPRRLDERTRRGQSELIATFADGRYAESNVRTAELTGIDLRAFGYEMGPDGADGRLETPSARAPEQPPRAAPG